MEKLSTAEEVAVGRLLDKYKIPRPDFGKPQEIVLPVPMDKAHGIVVKSLKHNEPMITCMKISGGKITETKSIIEAEAKKAEVVATTPVPNKGCPMPVFDSTKEKEIRATNVLKAFLNPTQRRDFMRQSSFVVVGADTGTKYLVNHRFSFLASEKGIVYDLDRECSTCVERTEQPPAEEMLGLLFMLGCKGRETEWRKQI